MMQSNKLLDKLNPVIPFLERLTGGVVLVHGDAAFFLRSLQDQIISILLQKKGADFNMDLFDHENFDPEQVILACNRTPFMAPMRVVLIRRIDEIDYNQFKRIQSVIEHPKKKVVLLLVAHKKMNRQMLGRKIFQGIKNILELKNPSEHQLNQFVKDFVNVYDKHIEPPAIRYLLNQIDQNLYLIENELLKMINIPGDEITIDDIISLGYQSRNHSVFELLEAIFRKDLGGSLRLIKRFFANTPQGEIIRFFSLLHQQYQRIMMFRYYLTKKYTQQQAASFANLNYYEKKRMSEGGIQNVPFKHLLKNYEILLAHEPLIKFGGPLSFNILEKMIYRLIKGAE